jgi:hypothetical protein
VLELPPEDDPDDEPLLDPDELPPPVVEIMGVGVGVLLDPVDEPVVELPVVLEPVVVLVPVVPVVVTDIPVFLGELNFNLLAELPQLMKNMVSSGITKRSINAIFISYPKILPVNNSLQIHNGE